MSVVKEARSIKETLEYMAAFDAFNTFVDRFNSLTEKAQLEITREIRLRCRRKRRKSDTPAGLIVASM